MPRPGRSAALPLAAALKRRFLGDDAYGWWQVLDAGWPFFRDTFKPQVGACVRSATREPYLAAQALYVLGDVYHYAFAAHGAAERTYRRAVTICPEHAPSWEALADIYHHGFTKRPRAAARAYEQLLRLDPRNADARRSLDQLASLEPEHVPQGPAYARIDDLLAAGRPHAALRILLRSRVFNRQILLARVYGMLGDVDHCWTCLQAAADTRDGLTFDIIDWFMYPDAIWERLEFWQLLYRRRKNIVADSAFPFDATIDQVVPPPQPHPGFASPAWGRWQRRRIEAQIRLRIARLERGDSVSERSRPRVAFGADAARAFGC